MPVFQNMKEDLQLGYREKKDRGKDPSQMVMQMGEKNPGLAQYLTFLPVSDIGSKYGRKPGAL